MPTVHRLQYSSALLPVVSKLRELAVVLCDIRVQNAKPKRLSWFAILYLLYEHYAVQHNSQYINTDQATG